MAITDAQKRATDKYHEKLDDIKIRVPKGKRDELKKIAESKGFSLQGYIKHLIEQDSGLVL